MKIASASLSKPGGRANNNDCIGQLTPEGGISCWVVADGQDEFAGRLAVDAILEAFSLNPAISRPILANVIDWAHRKMLSPQTTANPRRASFSLFCSGGRSALWAHVGNARLYAFRDGEVIVQTQDHSVSQTLVNAGQVAADELRSHGDRRRLLRALGQQGSIQPVLPADKFMLQLDDLFLLCTDGFWEYVTELEMQLEWCKSSDPADWLERMEIRLLRAAPVDHDNYSAIALLVEP